MLLKFHIHTIICTANHFQNYFQGKFNYFGNCIDQVCVWLSQFEVRSEFSDNGMALFGSYRLSRDQLGSFAALDVITCFTSCH